MNHRKVLKFFVLILGILTANLITTHIDEYFMSYKGQTKTFLFTWLGMLVIVAVYYPLFKFIDSLSIKISNLMLRKGKIIIGRSYGVYVIFLIILFVLYYFYGQLWFKINVFESFLNFLI